MWTAVATAALPARDRPVERIWWTSESPTSAVAVIVRGLMGQGGGDIPAAVTSNAIRQELTGDADIYGHDVRVRAAMVNAMEVAEEHLRCESNSRACGPIGATLVALVVSGARAVIAHVGNCRAYRWRAGRLEQLTEDHTLRSLYEQVVPKPAVDPTVDLDTVLTRTLGFPPHESKADVRIEPILWGDMLLLCSPGLAHHLEPAEIAGCFERNRTVEEVCFALEAAAGRRRNVDQDVSYLVARVSI